jgi:hypothetical protein
VVTVGLGALLSASPAAADSTTPLSCRASVGSATFSSPLATAPSIEPIVANRAGTPCADDSETLPQRTFGSSDFGATVTVGHAGAFTYTTAALPAIADEAPGAAALASTQSVEIKTQTEDIVLGQVQAQAGYACTAGAIVPSSSSSIGSVTVNGTPVTIPLSSPYKVNLTSDGASYLLLNQTTSAGGSLTQQAVVVHIAGPFGTAADFVIAEAKVSGGSGACAGTGTIPPPSIQPCAAGSVYNILDQQCEIVGAAGLPPVSVSTPYQGPTGGSVLGLAAARKLYSSPCLNGPGPAYVIVATQPGQRINGTAKADRILALGAHERVAGMGGADCIDGRGAVQTIWGGNGNNRIYGGSGKTRIGDGNGNDYINGRSGADWITAGNGRDKVHGGHGSSRIDVGIGFDHVWGGPAHNRIYAPAFRAVVSCGSGRHNVAFVRKGSWNYAHKHGCESLHMLAA